MLHVTKKPSFTIYKPLYKLSQFFSVFPNNSKCYSYITVLFYLLILIMKVNLQPGVRDSVQMLDLFINILASFCTLLSVANLNFVKKDKIRDLFVILTTIDLDLSHTYKCERKLSYKGRLTFFVSQAVIILLTLMAARNSYVYLDFKFTLQYIPVYIYLYVVVLVILQYNFLVAVIGIRCKLLNDKLSELGATMSVYKKSKTSVRSILVQNINSKFFTKNYERINDATILVNNIFGLQILFIFALILLFVVRALNIVFASFVQYLESNRIRRTPVVIGNLSGSFIFLVSEVLVFLL
jgi:hypothetical protein